MRKREQGEGKYGGLYAISPFLSKQNVPISLFSISETTSSLDTQRLFISCVLKSFDISKLCWSLTNRSI